MRVLIAPDKFAGTLTAVHAAEAIAEGWLRRAPGDEVRCVPMADGGPGFVDVLHESLGGELLGVWTIDPFGDKKVPGSVLLVDGTAYIESAQACGRPLVGAEDPGEVGAPDGPGPDDRLERATTVGVGGLMQSALEAGARKLVVGLGGSGTNDGGAGMLGALGAVDGSGSADPFRTVRGLRGITQVDLSRCVEAFRGVELVAGSDVDNPLLGLRGATNVYGGQKGITDDRKMFFESCLEDFANATDRRLADAKGAGAAGGLGFGLLLLGAERVPGVDLVAGAVRLAEHAAWADLVITGEGTFDFQSRSGKVVYGVAEAAGQAVRPCVALAGQVDVGAREMRAMGVESAYSLADLVGLDEALNRPRESLVELGARVARTWSH